jgi:hypothetical protein
VLLILSQTCSIAPISCGIGPQYRAPSVFWPFITTERFSVTGCIEVIGRGGRLWAWPQILAVAGLGVGRPGLPALLPKTPFLRVSIYLTQIHETS